jgi:hypothetical protein
MRASIETSAPNSLILVMDRTVGVVPDTMGDQLIVATPSCVAVGTAAEVDALTNITLSNEAPTRSTTEPVFDALLETPSRKLAVCSVLDDVFLEMPVGEPVTRVRIWVNHATEPDDINILVTDERNG